MDRCTITDPLQVTATRYPFCVKGLSCTAPTGDLARSLTDPDVRRIMANLLQAVLDAVDPTGADLQLLDLQTSITADRTAVNEIEQRAATAEALWTEEELDF